MGLGTAIEISARLVSAPHLLSRSIYRRICSNSITWESMAPAEPKLKVHARAFLKIQFKFTSRPIILYIESDYLLHVFASYDLFHRPTLLEISPFISSLLCQNVTSSPSCACSCCGCCLVRQSSASSQLGTELVQSVFRVVFQTAHHHCLSGC